MEGDERRLDRRDRFRGCLVGLVTGECVGASLEGLSPTVIQRLHDEVTEIRGGGFLGLEAGQHAQATDLMLCVAESLVGLGRFDMDDVVARWLAWKASGPRAIEETTLDALERIEKGTGWRDAGRKVTQANAAGNGALSRVAPLALFFLGDRDSLVQHAAEVAGATHAHPVAVAAAVATAVLLSELGDGATVVEAVEVAATTARARDESIVAGCIRGSSAKDLRDLRSSSYCLHALELAAWCLARTESFEQAVVSAVNQGGDAATNGAIAGALAGAHHGHAAIPARWTSVVRAHDRVRDLADALHRLGAPRG